jgi:tripartite-type tricarboxylate transporter receptor subunit TctC
MAPSFELIKAGKLRAIAVTAAGRSAAYPDIPTVGETIPGYEVTGWAGMSAPKGTPAEIISKLNAEINAGLMNPNIKARYEEVGYIVSPSSPADFGKFIADETEKWGKVIKAAGIKPE